MELLRSAFLPGVVSFYNPFSGKVFAKHLFLGGFRQFRKMCSRRIKDIKKVKKGHLAYKKGLDMV
jgi:hypothetical protein